MGIQGLKLVDFVRLVKEQDVKRVVDIRGTGIVSASQNRFSPPMVREILTKIDVEYFHLPEAGEPEELARVSKENGSSNNYEKRYIEILKSKNDIVKKIKEIFSVGNVLILSYEADFEKSTRKNFTNALKIILDPGIDVKNLTPKDLKPLVIPPPPPIERG